MEIEQVGAPDEMSPVPPGVPPGVSPGASPDLPSGASQRGGPRAAVVLAAGRSERLSTVTGGGSKALLRVAGLSLVERAVRTLMTAGIRDVLVVVGYHAGPVAAVVDSIRGLVPGSVRTVLVEDWEAGNGASLAAAAPYLHGDDRFVVMTADHVFGERALDELLRSDEPGVLVDLHPARGVLEEGTRVSIHDGAVFAFGKELDEPAVDCGVFVLTPAIFSCQRRAAAEGDGSLAGAVSRFAERSPLRAVPIPSESWWQDVDTPEDLQSCRRLLRRSLAKDADGPVSRVINRPLSTRLSVAIAPARLSPDVLSWLAFGVGLVAAVLLRAGAGIAGGMLAQAMSVLDGMDGEAARLQMRASPRGALLDGVLDRVADVVLVGALGLWAFDTMPDRQSIVLALTVAATFGSLMSMASKDRIAAYSLPVANERGLSWLLGGRDGRILLIAVFSIAGLPVGALAAVAATSLVTLALRLLAVRRLSS